MWNGTARLRPVGYGYRSIEALVEACGVEGQRSDLIATPANSWYNEAVIEARAGIAEARWEMVPVDRGQIS